MNYCLKIQINLSTNLSIFISNILFANFSYLSLKDEELFFQRQ